MGKVITVDPSQVSAENRTRVQNWLFSTGESFLTKTVGEEEVPIENASEVTAVHIEEWLKQNLKKNVRTFQKGEDATSFEAGYTDVELESP
jgi:hypothetical protein